MHVYCPSPQPGAEMRVIRTGQVGRVKYVDLEWGSLFPHKGPMFVLEIDGDRKCYSRCELEPLHSLDLPAFVQ